MSQPAAASPPGVGREAVRAAVLDRLAAGDGAAVAAAVGTLLGESAHPGDAAFVERALRRAGASSGLRHVPTLVVRSVTVEPLLPVLVARAAAAGLHLDIAAEGYASWGELVVGDLDGPRPDLLLLALEPGDLVGDAFAHRFGGLTPAAVADAVEEAAGRLACILASARHAMPGVRLAVQGFVPPAWPALGVVADAQRGAASEAGAVRALNARLAEVVASLGDGVLIDLDALVAREGARDFRDPRLWHLARVPIAAAYHDAWARWVVRHLRPVFLPPRKVLVLDLDGTLWGGTLGDDGPDGVQTGEEYPGSCHLALQREARQLADRGVVLALASRNDRDAVEECFARRAADLGIGLDAFAAVRVAWEPKVQLLRELAEELSLGLDSFVFVDDSAFECAAVRASLPEVLVVQAPAEPYRLPGLLLGLEAFEAPRITEDDVRRSERYRVERRRRALRAHSPSMDEFLRSLDIVVTLLAAEQAGIARIAQLTQRNNQFNVTGRRYGEDDLRRLAGRPGGDVFAVRVHDALGDSGVVGAVVARYAGDTAVVEAFVLSCRVIGRGVEGALLAVLGERARAAGCRRLVGEFVATPRNARARELYARHGFAPLEPADGGRLRFHYDLAHGGPVAPSWIRVESEPR